MLDLKVWGFNVPLATRSWNCDLDLKSHVLEERKIESGVTGH